MIFKIVRLIDTVSSPVCIVVSVILIIIMHYRKHVALVGLLN